MRRIIFPKSLLPLLHSRAIISGQIHDPFVAGNILESLLRAYPSAHFQAHALLSFSPHHSTFMYNTLLHAYLCNNLPTHAILLFYEMLLHGTTPNNHTFPLVLKAFSQAPQYKNGAFIHTMILKRRLDSDSYVHASLIHFYGAAGCIVEARRVFDEKQLPGISAWTALLSGYAKNGNLSMAWELFVRMPDRNLVSWSAMISGYVQCRKPEKALALFQEMMKSKVRPNCSVLVNVLVAAAEVGALQVGKWVHMYLEKNCMCLSSNLKTSLVHMYARCGDLLSAKQTFRRFRDKNVDLWNAIITGIGLYGRGEEAFELFVNMSDDGIPPDDMTFIGLLSACSHSGMVAEGRKCFEAMSKIYRIEPKLEHYSCMVDLLAKAGLVNEMVQLIQTMPMEPNARIWGSLFSSCRILGDITSGEIVGKQLIQLEPRNSGCYVQLANLYASSGRWQEAVAVRDIMKRRGVVLEPGCSLIEVDGMVHEFLVGDKTHPKANEICCVLDVMARSLRVEGYVLNNSVS
ncbi:hypothetical protein HPP92_009682 [Vanilla planifolia]|uniref:Pentatricopeptide repeat-containing protein At5g66520-like n=1 Tax=Vanilla planifolia TaxID=51239 RepID=A0A835V5P0_VANPL|nr:hypothetical protein HPP92_009682 [Vanilla planifolia]